MRHAKNQESLSQQKKKQVVKAAFERKRMLNLGKKRLQSSYYKSVQKAKEHHA